MSVVYKPPSLWYLLQQPELSKTMGKNHEVFTLEICVLDVSIHNIIKKFFLKSTLESQAHLSGFYYSTHWKSLKCARALGEAVSVGALGVLGSHQAISHRQ